MFGQRNKVVWVLKIYLTYFVSPRNPCLWVLRMLFCNEKTRECLGRKGSFLNYVMDQIHLSTMWSFKLSFTTFSKHSYNTNITPVKFSIYKDSLRKFPGDPVVRTRVWSLVGELRSWPHGVAKKKIFFNKKIHSYASRKWSEEVNFWLCQQELYYPWSNLTARNSKRNN